MKKITKFLTTAFVFVLVITGALCLSGCERNNDDDKNLCTVSYNLNFKNTDYNVLKKYLNNGLSFNVDGFVEQSNIVEAGNVNIVYTKKIELGRGFILYEFKDKVLNNYFDGWYTSSGVRVNEVNAVVSNDITLYAKWKEDLETLTSAAGINFEYTFNEVNQTASFKNATANNYHNGVGLIGLPEIVFNNGKFYLVNDIENNSSREHMVYYVPKTYTGSVYYPIIFPNEDELGDNNITYLGNYISQQIGKVICIYEANYTTNTLTLKSVEKGSTTSYNPYLTLGKDVTFCREGESVRTLKVTNFYYIYPGDKCPYTQFIVSKDANVRYPKFSYVLQDNNNKAIDVFFEHTIDEVYEIDPDWIESVSFSRPGEEIYYYSETEPAEDECNYWHYVNGNVVVW